MFGKFCRSPVAKFLMQERFKQFNFDSAGINPILQPHMDRRSEKFLKSKNILDTQHLPKKIDHKIVINSKQSCNGCFYSYGTE